MTQSKATRFRKALTARKPIPVPQQATPSASKAIPARYLQLPLGQIRPEGWMLAQIKRDLSSGFAGCLDELTPANFNDVFGKERKHEKRENPNPPQDIHPRHWW